LECIDCHSLENKLMFLIISDRFKHLICLFFLFSLQSNIFKHLAWSPIESFQNLAAQFNIVGYETLLNSLIKTHKFLKQELISFLFKKYFEKINFSICCVSMWSWFKKVTLFDHYLFSIKTWYRLFKRSL